MAPSISNGEPPVALKKVVCGSVPRLLRPAAKWVSSGQMTLSRWEPIAYITRTCRWSPPPPAGKVSDAPSGDILNERGAIRTLRSRLPKVLPVLLAVSVSRPSPARQGQALRAATRAFTHRPRAREGAATRRTEKKGQSEDRCPLCATHVPDRTAEGGYSRSLTAQRFTAPPASTQCTATPRRSSRQSIRQSR